MATMTQVSRYELAKRELVALDRVAGRTIACESGELWITCDGRREDIILGPGASWQVPSDADLVVSALQASAFTLTRPRTCVSRNGRAERILSSLLRWRHPPLASLPAAMLR